VTGFEGGVVGDYSAYTSFEYAIYLEAQGWSDLRVRFHFPERHRNSVFAVVVEDAFMDRELRLGTEISNTLAHHPAVDEKNCSVGLSCRGRPFVKYKTDRNIDLGGYFQVECCDEETDSSCCAG